MRDMRGMVNRTEQKHRIFKHSAAFGIGGVRYLGTGALGYSIGLEPRLYACIWRGHKRSHMVVRRDTTCLFYLFSSLLGPELLD